MITRQRPSFRVFLAYLTCFFVLVFISMFAFDTVVFAGPENYRQCVDTSNCEIGEFLFDDDYTPIPDATCTFTARDPAGTIHLNNVPMSANADGWYSYDVATSGEAYGLYRAQICCTSGPEYICLDKSFIIASESASLTQEEVAGAVWDAQTSDHNTAGSFGENLQNPSSLSAADVWDYPQRTLTSFGTLIADIWSYSTRSLNSFASLIAGIWDNTDRTLTEAVPVDTTGLATSDDVSAVGTKVDTVSGKIDDLESDVSNVSSQVTNVANSQTTNNNNTTTNITNITNELTEISQAVAANRVYLEQLYNAPIIETFIEDDGGSPLNLISKIDETKKIARLLSQDVDDIGVHLASINSNWETTNYQIALNGTDTASKILGVTSQSSEAPENINARVAWLEKNWRSPIVSNLSFQTVSAITNISGINREVKNYGKTFISKQYLEIANDHIKKIGELVGEEGDGPTKDTLFGYIAEIERVSDLLVKQSLELDEMFVQWHTLTNSEKDQKLSELKTRVLEVNKIPDSQVLLKEKLDDEKHRENLALAIQGLIEANLTYMANSAEKVTHFIWMEFGSLKFKSLITNPSGVVAQEVTVKYYLPEEVLREHIINIDEGLKANFDLDRNSLYVEGKFLLQPEETRTIIVEVADVYVISQDEITSLRNQSDLLFDSLKNTSYFAQGSIFKSDIDVNLDKVESLMKNNQTPEMKIRAYREAILEMDAAKEKLENLKTLASSAGSLGSVFGFVGGVQAVAVWGLIIILVAGFVFLLIYLRTISGSTLKRNEQKKAEEINEGVSAKVGGKNIKNDDLSVFGLIKDIINLKVNTGKKSSVRPHKRLSVALIFMIVIIIALISLVTLLLYERKTAVSPELLSPVPSGFQVADGLKALPTEVPESTKSAFMGLVLGINNDSLVEEASDESETLLASTQDTSPNGYTKTTVRIIIPEGYKAINVRVSPSSDSELVSRLYTNQNVIKLQQKDGWVLIETNTVGDEKPIVGWILQNLVSEIIE